LSATSLGARFEDALRTFNKYRSPEVVAELTSLEQDGRRFVVRFTGSFCRTCGFYDYFEDLIYDLLDESCIKARIVDVKEDWQSEDFKVTYQMEEPEPENIIKQQDHF